MRRQFDKQEFERWMKQAKYTLESASEDLQHGRYSWCCFKSQQAAEYAVKGLLYGLGLIPLGHSVTKLLTRLERRGIQTKEILKHARLLDRHYIPTRYPNAHPEGAPFEYYDEGSAKEALRNAERILQAIKKASKT
jgi:HEPN domain-containing protein